jgi:hypothetical protein
MRLSILLVLAITSIVLGQIENLTLDPPVMMPEGNQFLTWENKTVYSRTYYIDQNAVNASDDNPGTDSRI